MTLDGTAVFARRIRVSARAGGTDQRPAHKLPTGKWGVASTRLALTGSVKMHLASNANILLGDHTLLASQLVMGSLVSLTFTSGKDKGTRREPDLGAGLAWNPLRVLGSNRRLDLRRGLLVVVDPRTHKTYDIHSDTVAGHLTRDLKQGSNVTVQANYTGTRYEGRDITVNSQ